MLGVGVGGVVVLIRANIVSRFVEPVTLTGERWVSLEPLTRAHIPEIAEAAADGEVGSLWFTTAPKPQAAERWVERMLDMQAGDQGVTFVVRRRAGTLVGSSSYFHVDPPNRRLEIGHTWYVAPAAAHRRQRRDEAVDARPRIRRVELRGSGIPHALLQLHQPGSHRAAGCEARRGAAQPQVLPDGSRRDTVVYSILDIEWPAVRSNLRYRLDRNASLTGG